MAGKRLISRKLLVDSAGRDIVESFDDNDTVNVASRLQSLSKDLDTRLVASEALVTAVKDEVRKEGELVQHLKFVGPTQLRCRENETIVYALDGGAMQREVA